MITIYHYDYFDRDFRDIEGRKGKQTSSADTNARIHFAEIEAYIRLSANQIAFMNQNSAPTQIRCAQMEENIVARTIRCSV